MPRDLKPTRALALAALLALGLAGCKGKCCCDDVHYLGSADLNYYKKTATKVDYPDTAVCPSDKALMTDEPRRLGSQRKDELWDMPLFEAIRLALENNPVIRNRAQFLRPGTAPVSDSQSVFDPAIVESETVYGQQGVEAALSEFDAQLITTMLWGKDDLVQNNFFQSGGLPPGSTLMQDTGAFVSRLQKQLANGGLVALNHNWDYQWANTPGRLFPSTYIGKIEAEYRQPFLAGYGTEFTRIAGPYNRRDPFRNSQSLDQGVVIARIRNDMSLADFQAAVRNLVKDVEDLYWELYLGYRVYDGEIISRNAALQTWREVKGRMNAGLPGGGAADEAQARDTYFDSRARSEQALADVYERETNLRRMLGLTVNDGRIIRPCDDPLLAEYCPDWHVSLAEALTRRAELRKQKWQIKSYELQLVAAKSLVMPRLDFVSKYRVNGFGDQLFAPNDNDGVTIPGYRSAYGSITDGDQTGWNLGFEFSMPIGFRAAHSQVRNIELRLAKARTQLVTQELDISHELSIAFQSMARWYQVTQTHFARLQATDDRVKAFQADYLAGRLPAVDLLLRSQISRAQANNEYFRSVIEYNKSIASLHLRKETLLDHDNVRLSESMWDRAAYQDALRRAWARSYAHPNCLLHDEPAPFARSGPANALPVAHTAEVIDETIPGDSGFQPPDAGPAGTKLPEPPPPGRASPYDTNSEQTRKPLRGLDALLNDVAEPLPPPPRSKQAASTSLKTPVMPTAGDEAFGSQATSYAAPRGPRSLADWEREFSAWSPSPASSPGKRLRSEPTNFDPLDEDPFAPSPKSR